MPPLARNLTEPTAPDLKEYRLYISATSGQYDTTKPAVVIPKPTTETTCSEAGITTDQTFFAVMTAVDQAGNESAFSNEVSSTRDTTPPEEVILEIIKRPDGSIGLRVP